ncbi:MAG: EAL domain-containing protein [Deltaproteobacteria bacterium]|nr:EAL domain-containing protein [Deltaproteobacteria bacterium]
MSKKQILIAEDEAIVSEDLKMMLERLGYTVPAIAVSGEEVVEKALKIKPDLLLMDIVLKGKIDGIEAATQIYEKLNIPIVYVTAYSDEKTLTRAKKTEPYGYIIKPYNERDLRITIEIALQHYKPCIKMLEKKCRVFLEATPDVTIISDKGIIITANRQSEKVFGYKWSELIGKPIEILLPDEYRGVHIGHMETYYANPSVRPMGDWLDLFARRKDGAKIPVSINLGPIETEDGLYVITVIRDITETRRTEAELTLLQSITQDISGANDFCAALEVVLRKVCEKTGWIMGEAWVPMPDGSCLEYSQAWYSRDSGLEEFRKASEKLTFPPGVGLPGSVWSSKQSVWIQDVTVDKNFPRSELAKKARIKGGVAIPVLAHDAVVAVMSFFVYEEKKEDKRFVGLISAVASQLGIFIQQKQSEERINYLAYHDILTGLPNRLMLHDKIEEAISGARKEGRSIALFIIDLDHFKDINDTLGHQHGDTLLVSIADRLKNIFADTGTVSRLGGDDFTVILPGADVETVSRFVDKITKSLDEPFLIGDIPINTTACIGVSFFPGHGEDTHTLLRRADIALHEARKQGSNWAIYSPEYEKFSSGHLALIGVLRHAIDSNQMFLLYQPKIDLKTSKVIGVEALVRWQHPTNGVIPPDQFIFLAEHSGLIKQLTSWVIGEALCQARGWQSAGRDISVAANLSVRSLYAPMFLDQTKGLLATWGVDPGRLRLEITESVIMSDPELAMEIITQLTIMGVRFSIDDFGIGYSSLKYLQRLPVDEIKIDKSFVMKMLSDENSLKIVHSTIELAHSLGLKVVAEGVESQETMDRLASLGCDAAQGYFISRPITNEELVCWMDKQ